MSWKFFLYDWGGLNIALFQAINTGTPATLKPLAWFFGLVGSYWTAPLMLLGLWWWSKSATNPARGTAVRHRLIGFSAAFLLALLVATALKLWFDFPRPPAVLGDLVRVIGDKELHYSLPSGHATYAAMVVGALWPLMGRRGRLSLMLYATLVGWSRIAAGMHFPADVLAGWTLGWSCTALAGWLLPLAAPVWQSARRTSAWVWFTVAASAVMTDQLAKFAIIRTFAYGEQVEITPFFNSFMS
jgi:signal peptidase II